MGGLWLQEVFHQCLVLVGLPHCGCKYHFGTTMLLVLDFTMHKNALLSLTALHLQNESCHSDSE